MPATVREINGQLVLEDDEALGVITVVEAHNLGIARRNCEQTFDSNRDRVKHFLGRMAARRDSPQDVVIVLINVDDPHGGPVADALMPGHNWQQFRDQGLVPYARGLAARAGMEEVLGHIDPEVARALRAMTETAIVVIDHGIAMVYPAKRALCP